MTADRPPRALLYDVFLSHSHADRDWTRALFRELAHTDYNGRVLRPWLDREVLDPGPLSSDRELESALDRSRFLALVLSADALQSSYVQAEIGYFLQTRRASDVIVLDRRQCSVPDELSGATLIDVSHGNAAPVDRLLRVLRPQARGNRAAVSFGTMIYKNWKTVLRKELSGLAAGTDNSRLLDLLLSYDINDLDQEGSAITAFDMIGLSASGLSVEESYRPKMVLSEFLAVAVLRNIRYARVLASYVSQDIAAFAESNFDMMRRRMLGNEAGPQASTNLLFAVARAYSKLAEIDPSRVDLSTVGALLNRLDDRGLEGKGERSTAMMILRTLGKLRNTPVADVLIHTLAKWGRDASCYAAAGAIAEEFSREHGLYYFTRELAQLNADRSASPELRPPSGSTASLLLDTGSSLYRGNVLKDIQIFRTGLTSRGTDLPGGDTVGAALRPAPAPTELVNGPLVGRVRKVTRATMESLADTLGPGDIACLTEPRIVDALFEGVSGYLISHDEVDQPLGIRLAARSARFASYTADVLHELEDGTAMALWPSGRAGATPTGHVAAPASSSGQRRLRL